MLAKISLMVENVHSIKYATGSGIVLIVLIESLKKCYVATHNIKVAQKEELHYYYVLHTLPVQEKKNQGF